MAKIPRSKVSITPVFLVDCEACGEAVVEENVAGLGNSYGYYTRKAAQEAKDRHLALHESGFFE